MAHPNAIPALHTAGETLIEGDEEKENEQIPSHKMHTVCYDPVGEQI